MDELACAPVGLVVGPSGEAVGDCAASNCEGRYPTGMDLALVLENVGGGGSVVIECFFFFGFLPGNVDEGLRPR